MEQMNVISAITDIDLSEVMVNPALPTDVCEAAGELLKKGCYNADLLAISDEEGDTSLVIVPNWPTRKRLFRSAPSEILSPDAERRLISRNIAKGLADEAHPFTKSVNDFGGAHPCTVCGSVLEKSMCEPLDKAIGFPFTFAMSPVSPDENDIVEDESSEDSTTDGAVQVKLDPATVAAILQAVQAANGDEDSSSSSTSSSSSSSSEMDGESSSSSSSVDDSDILGENWKDGLDPWQVQLAESLDEMVEDMGRVPTTDASYTDVSPYAGQNCGTCIAMGESGCDWVAVSCSPEGWCKFNVTPVLLRAAGENEQYYKARKAASPDEQKAAPEVSPEKQDTSEDTSDESTSSGGQDLAQGEIEKGGPGSGPQPGHAFYGNQYQAGSGGGGGADNWGDKNNSEKALADVKAADYLTVWSDGPMTDTAAKVMEAESRHPDMEAAYQGKETMSNDERSADAIPKWLVNQATPRDLDILTDHNFHSSVRYIQSQRPDLVAKSVGEIQKDSPTVEGVHVDGVIGAVGVLPKFVPVELDIIEEQQPEVLVAAKSAEIPGTIQKSDEKRYTLGPWYVPNQKDAHGEWTDPEELQKALWGYVESGDRDIRLQHNVNVVAGKWVEAMMWPHAVEVPMLKADTQEIVKTTFPAGTAFLGVQWEPWAWELVKKGEIRGFSIGGTGSPIEVDLPSEFDDPNHFPLFGK